MSSVRVLVGTRKGAFILTVRRQADRSWKIDGPHFGGWEIYHLKGSPADPNRIYASQSSGWFGQTDPALRRRRQDLAAGRQQIRLRRRARHAPVVRRHAAPVGIQTRLAPRAVADRSRHGLRRRRRCRHISAPPTAGKPGTSSPACAATPPDPTGSRAPAACVCTRSCSIPKHPGRIYVAISAAGAFRTDDGGETWKPINRGLRSRIHSRSERRGRPLRASHRHAPLAAERALHAEALGRDAQRRRGRLVARGQRQSAHRFRLSPSTFTPTNRRRSTSFRSRAIRSTIPPKESCASTAAAPAATNGSRSPTACRSAIATSTCCATRWPSTRSIRAAFTSAPPAARSTRRPTRATTGLRSSATCRPCSPSRCRRCHDPRRPAVPSATSGAASAAKSMLDVPGPVTQRSILDALEARYPMLCGTIRDQVTHKRRAFLRFFACRRDLSHESPDTPLPEAVVQAPNRSW